MWQDFVALVAIQSGMASALYLDLAARDPMDRPDHPFGAICFRTAGMLGGLTATILAIYALWDFGLWRGVLAIFTSTAIGIAVERSCPSGIRPGVALLLFCASSAGLAFWLST